MFVNNPNTSSDGREVNSTTYTTRTAFNLGAVVTFYVRAATTYYWSEVGTLTINILGECKTILYTVLSILFCV